MVRAIAISILVCEGSGAWAPLPVTPLVQRLAVDVVEAVAAGEVEQVLEGEQNRGGTALLRQQSSGAGAPSDVRLTSGAGAPSIELMMSGAGAPFTKLCCRLRAALRTALRYVKR